MSATDEHAEELVPVQVPRSRLTDVYALLSGRFSMVPAGPQGRSEDEEEGWTLRDFERLLKDTRPSSARMFVVLDVLAAAPDTHVALSELARRAELSVGELKGALSGFTRVCNSLWPDQPGAAWPMEVSWGTAVAGDQAGEAYYRIDAETAERWRTARALRRG